MKIWAILGARQGDNNQVLALAEALGMPFEVKQLSYNRWRHLGPRILGASYRSLTRSSQAAVCRDPPDVTISTGHRSVPVVQALRRRSNGRTRSIHVGYPRISPAHFDLVIATPEYPIADHPNLMRIPFALTRRANREPADLDHAYPRPRRLMILGGPTLYWRLHWSAVRKALDALLQTAAGDAGSIVVVASPRTPTRLLHNVRSVLDAARCPTRLVPVGGSPSYDWLLDQSDAIFVTADSTAMISDAVASGKPVGLIPIGPTFFGRLAMTVNDRLNPRNRIHPRDLRFFWSSLFEQGLAGGVDKPTRGNAPNLNRLVAKRAAAVLNRRNS
jgi:hypothetical protein